MDTITLLSILGNSSRKQRSERNVSVCSCCVSELFNCQIHSIPGTEISGILSIPEYQRPYVWGIKEMSKLIADLNEHVNTGNDKTPMYYLGSLILHRDGEKLNIIDGQQRITTLALLGGVLGNSMPDIQFQSPASVHNIRKCLQYLRSPDMNGQIQKVDLSRINVSLVITDSEDEAYTFFETQNTGGVRLSGVDIIKAHHLRVVTQNGERQNKYAEIWEASKNISHVADLLLKARRWNVLDWRPVPYSGDDKGGKQAIIEEYSQRTLSNAEKTGYQSIALTNDYLLVNMSSLKLAVRQPLAHGENFVDYISVYCQLYHRLFIADNDHQIDDKYYDFYRAIVAPVDGTAFLKEFFQVAIMCYCSRYGFNKVQEAAVWIFRYSYAARLINQKTVREDSIPAFIKNKAGYLFDHILHCHTHDELMNRLQSFSYDVNGDNLTGNTVKSRYVQRVTRYFKLRPMGDIKQEFDPQLKIKLMEWRK
ncbi:MAG: DUF262 domain-containing protein [Flavipsychrobacter sp.]|nr:DUF262 domain-containing protein [Flavipsychrobacter sp.]